VPGEVEWISQLKHLGQQVIVTVAKTVALLIFVGLHWVLDAGIAAAIPRSWAKTQAMLETIVTIAFVFLYVDQLVEMVAVFVPRLGTLHSRFVRGDTQG
jgi:hypothetical protein